MPVRRPRFPTIEASLPDSSLAPHQPERSKRGRTGSRLLGQWRDGSYPEHHLASGASLHLIVLKSSFIAGSVEVTDDNRRSHSQSGHECNGDFSPATSVVCWTPEIQARSTRFRLRERHGQSEYGFWLPLRTSTSMQCCLRQIR